MLKVWHPIKNYQSFKEAGEYNLQLEVKSIVSDPATSEIIEVSEKDIKIVYVYSTYSRR